MNILMLLKTTGLEYDDRIRKESLTLKKRVDNLFIAVLRKDNKAINSTTDYGIPLKAISLISRKKMFKKRFLTLKLLEMYLKFLVIILKRKPDTIWIHDKEMMGFLPILYFLKKMNLINKIIWDQHELLDRSFTENVFKKKLLEGFFSIADKIIVANEERYDYYINNINNRIKNKMFIIHNYADENFFELDSNPLSKKILKWLGSDDYILAQGGAYKSRYIEKIIEAIIEFRKYKLIVVGSYNKNLLDEINKKFSCDIYDYIYFTGMIPQMNMVDYIDNAKASIIFYKNTKLNWKYCEPNRLYQAIIRGLPVIVGNNPPMGNLVKKYNNGIILKSDGRKKDDIIEALSIFRNNYNDYLSNATKCKNKFKWELQEDVIFDLLELN